MGDKSPSFGSLADICPRRIIQILVNSWEFRMKKILLSCIMGFSLNLQAKTFYEWCTDSGASDSQKHTVAMMMSAVSSSECQDAATKLNSKTALGFFAKNISDLSPMEGLTSLQFLFLDRNNVSDLSPLDGLHSLQEVNLTGNQVTNLNALGSLKKLNKLVLTGNLIVDVSPLRGLTSLRHLTLFNNQISSVEALSGLNNLEQLNLGKNSISQVSSLAGLSKLESLFLEENPIAKTEVDWLSAQLPNCSIFF